MQWPGIRLSWYDKGQYSLTAGNMTKPNRLCTHTETSSGVDKSFRRASVPLGTDWFTGYLFAIREADGTEPQYIRRRFNRLNVSGRPAGRGRGENSNSQHIVDIQVVAS